MNDKDIKESLLAQLKELNKDTEYNRSLIDDYMHSRSIVRKCGEDINNNGLTMEDARGVTRPNPSIANRQKELAIMLKIIQLLDLQNPVIRSDSMDDYM